MEVFAGIERLVTMNGSGPQGLGVLEHVDLLVEGGRVHAMLPQGSQVYGPEVRVHPFGPGAVIPGLVDCHTHTVFGGDRSAEFELKLRGVGYEEIARGGGGILHTVTATRAAAPETLFRRGRDYLLEMLAHGVTTVELKSGYGLDTEDELKMLEVAARLGKETPLTVVPTFLGAHEFPQEYRQNHEGYVRLLLEDTLPAVAAQGVARFCDVFCERGVFDVQQSRRILTTARELGLGLKVHAEEFASIGAAALGIELDAISVDHLEHLDEPTMEALAESSTVPVILPGTAFFLDLTTLPPARAMLQRGLGVAVATDFNPGSNMCSNLPLCGTIACVRCRMLPHEVLRGMTVHAARALGLAGQVGELRPGAAADFVLLDHPDERNLFYHYGTMHARAVVKAGELVLDRRGLRID